MRVPAHVAGKRVRCPACTKPIHVPFVLETFDPILETAPKPVDRVDREALLRRLEEPSQSAASKPTWHVPVGAGVLAFASLLPWGTGWQIADRGISAASSNAFGDLVTGLSGSLGIAGIPIPNALSVLAALVAAALCAAWWTLAKPARPAYGFLCLTPPAFHFMMLFIGLDSIGIGLPLALVGVFLIALGTLKQVPKT